MATWFIEPLNEGQELNYSETHKGTKQSARKRAIIMVKELQRILKQGSISANILDKNAEEVAFITGRERLKELM